MKFFLLVLGTFITGSALCEYRVFELNVSDLNTGKSKIVKSSLGPMQYSEYNHVKPTETVTYKASWMCRGNTSHFLKYCRNPRPDNTTLAPERTPL